jgi:antitoxin FitA
MATLTIRDIDQDLKARLRVRAAENGRSMEAEVRAILRSALDDAPPIAGLGTWIHERFKPLGGVELDLPPRNQPPRAPDFGA